MEKIFSSPQQLALAVYEAQAEQDIEFQRYKPAQREKCIRDIVYNLDFLEQAYQVQSPDIFLDYIQWLNIVLSERGVSSDSLFRHLGWLQKGINEALSAKYAQALAPYFAHVREHWPALITYKQHSYIGGFNPLAKEAALYLDYLVSMNRNAALALVQEMLLQNISVKDIYLYLFQPVQRELGRLWQINQIGVAQEHYATAVTQLAMSQLYPRIFSTERVGYRLVAACVGNELHEIGIRMVADFFEMAGWDTFYLGANTPTVSIISSILQQDADAVALSVTLSSQISLTNDLIREIRAAVTPRVKILVGGYPFNVEPQAWQRVGADGYAPDAEAAIQLAYSLVSA